MEIRFSPGKIKEKKNVNVNVNVGTGVGRGVVRSLAWTGSLILTLLL